MRLLDLDRDLDRPGSCRRAAFEPCAPARPPSPRPGTSRGRPSSAGRRGRPRPAARERARRGVHLERIEGPDGAHLPHVVGVVLVGDRAREAHRGSPLEARLRLVISIRKFSTSIEKGSWASMNCLATASPIETTTASSGRTGSPRSIFATDGAQAGHLALEEGQLRVELASALVGAAAGGQPAEKAHHDGPCLSGSPSSVQAASLRAWREDGLPSSFSCSPPSRVLEQVESLSGC